jgi:hypothetical protein
MRIPARSVMRKTLIVAGEEHLKRAGHAAFGLNYFHDRRQ